MRPPALTHDSAAVFLGDCLDVLAEMPDNSVDAIVCDPPYGLGFMGKAWDDLPPGLPWAEECLRVLKPGGHLLAFGGTRTWHRLAVAVEDAGFEVRDSIAWLYGSGFPKSLDVSKAIDKRRDEGADAEKRAIILAVTGWVAAARDAAGLSNRDIDAAFGTNGMAGHWTSSKSQPAVPTAEQWPRLLALLGADEPPVEVRDAVDEWLRIKGQPAPTWSLRVVTREATAPLRTGETISFDQRSSTQRERRDIPATDAAAQWQGWGTALKPAFEPIVVARKPLVGTVAANVLAYGTGALNIDATRVGASWGPVVTRCASCAEPAAPSARPETPETRESTATKPAEPTSSERAATPLGGTSRTATGCSPGPTLTGAEGSSSSIGPSGSSTTAPSPTTTSSTTSTRKSRTTGSRTCTLCCEPITPDTTTSASSGRWPSNVLLDGDAAAELDEQSGERPGMGSQRVLRRGATTGSGIGYGSGSEGEDAVAGYADSGGASRFFPTFRYQAKAPTRERPSYVDDAGNKIAHATVKPLALMRWLVRLVTPPGGTVLDTFAGSGATVEAAIEEGFYALGIEREESYLPLIQVRLDRVQTPEAAA